MAGFSVELQSPGLARLRARFRQLPSVVSRELRTGAGSATAALRAEIARRTPIRTGRLHASVAARLEGGGSFLRGVVSSASPYASHVEHGTRPHVIRPRFVRVLRFNAAGRVVFAAAVRHPGTTGHFMFREGLKAATPVITRLLAARQANVTKALRGR